MERWKVLPILVEKGKRWDFRAEGRDQKVHPSGFSARLGFKPQSHSLTPRLEDSEIGLSVVFRRLSLLARRLISGRVLGQRNPEIVWAENISHNDRH